MIVGEGLGCDFELGEIKDLYLGKEKEEGVTIETSSEDESESDYSEDDEDDLLPFQKPRTLLGVTKLLQEKEDDDKKLKVITALNSIPSLCVGKGLEVIGVLRCLGNISNDFNIHGFEVLMGEAVGSLLKLNPESGFDYLIPKIFKGVGEGLRVLEWLEKVVVDWDNDENAEDKEEVKSIKGSSKKGEGGRVNRFVRRKKTIILKNTFRNVGPMMFALIVNNLNSYKPEEDSKLILNGVTSLLIILIEKTGWQNERVRQVEVMKVLLISFKGRIDWEVGLEGVRVVGKWAGREVDLEELVECWREEINMISG